MRYITIGLGIAIVMGVIIAVLNATNTVEVIQPSEPKTIVKVQKVDVLEERIKKAQEEAMPEIVEKAQAQYDAYVESEKQRIADEVKTAYIAELEKTIKTPDY